MADTEGLAGVTAQVEKLTRDAVTKKPSVVALQGEPRGKYLLVDKDGIGIPTIPGAGWHSEHLDTPQELKRFIEKNLKDTASVFYDETKIIFVSDLADRRDIAACDLVKSEPYIFLASKPGPQNQKDFVRTLRITLRGCLDSSSNLIQLVRDLKFTSGGEVEGSIQHGNESMGRKIANQVTGQGAIPEEITLRIRVFENHPAIVPVACALEILPAEGCFRLTPYPMELRKAMDDTLSSVAFVFSDDGLPPVYRGRP